MCPCPHWGYVLSGKIEVKHIDGTRETVNAGDVHYWPPGHTVWFDEDTEYVEFSPEKPMNEVLAHVVKVMAET
ncbi:MAG: cupin domain-containing protein [Myxococcota bacterium]